MEMKSRPVRLAVGLLSIASAWTGAFFAYGLAVAGYAVLCVSCGMAIGYLLCGAFARDQN